MKIDKYIRELEGEGGMHGRAGGTGGQGGGGGGGGGGSDYAATLSLTLRIFRSSAGFADEGLFAYLCIFYIFNRQEICPDFWKIQVNL